MPSTKGVNVPVLPEEKWVPEAILFTKQWKFDKSL